MTASNKKLLVTQKSNPATRQVCLICLDEASGIPKAKRALCPCGHHLSTAGGVGECRQAPTVGASSKRSRKKLKSKQKGSHCPNHPYMNARHSMTSGKHSQASMASAFKSTMAWGRGLSCRPPIHRKSTPE